MHLGPVSIDQTIPDVRQRTDKLIDQCDCMQSFIHFVCVGIDLRCEVDAHAQMFCKICQNQSGLHVLKAEWQHNKIYHQSVKDQKYYFFPKTDPSGFIAKLAIGMLPCIAHIMHFLKLN